MFCKSTPLVLRNSIQEKDNAEKSPFTKLYLLLTNRELSVKGLFLILLPLQDRDCRHGYVPVCRKGGAESC